MTAILKSHETNYVKCVVPIKGARGLIPLAFYLAVTVVGVSLSSFYATVIGIKCIVKIPLQWTISVLPYAPILYHSRCIIMANNEELAKTVESLTASVKSMQDQLTTLTSGATYSGVNSQSGSGLQYSGTDSDGCADVGV